MPAMSVTERLFCRSAPWRIFARRAILPWALQGTVLRGQVLDLGSGSGAMAEGMARAYPDVSLTVTDVDPVMVESARQRLRRLDTITVQQADVTGLPFGDASFDAVTCYLMLHHVIEWRPAREVHRVLRPGGLLVGYDLSRTRGAAAVHVVDRSPYRLVGRSELQAELLSTGFGGVRVTRAFAGLVMRFAAKRAP
jgi:ubiquinone/menaquinone biosynthesis C-methylase UbiE